MGRSCLHLAFLITSFFIISSSHGCGRRLLKSYEDEEYATNAHAEGNGRDGFRKMTELDYDYPEPNDNPKYDFLVSPPPPPPLARAPIP